MQNENKTLLAPHKMNIFGRKRYSVDTNACDYLDYSLDDIWNAIKRLWVAMFLFGIFLQRIIVYIKKK